MKSGKLFIFCINQKKLLKKYTITSLSQCNYKMDTILMYSENSKTSEPCLLILNLTYKLDVGRGENSIATSNLSIYYTWQNIKSSCNNNQLKISAPKWNDKFELPDGTLYQIFKIILGIF